MKFSSFEEALPNPSLAANDLLELELEVPLSEYVLGSVLVLDVFSLFGDTGLGEEGGGGWSLELNPNPPNIYSNERESVSKVRVREEVRREREKKEKGV